MNTNDEDIKTILRNYEKITVIGMSPDAHKPSQEIPNYMRENGYEIVGVNPAQTEINGFKVYPKLADVPAEYRKFVNVFRRPEHIPAVVDEVLKAGGVEVLWLQLGISHEEAEKLAEKAGIKVVSNRCLLIEHRKHS
jgi:predicted CoA-binding protein